MRDMNRTSGTEPRDPLLQGWECLCNPTWTERHDAADSTMMASWRVFILVCFLIIFIHLFGHFLHCQDELTASTAF